MSRCVRCGTKPAKRAPVVSQPRLTSTRAVSGWISTWMGSLLACGVVVCPWQSTNASAGGMCIAKSKSAPSLKPRAGQNVRGWPPFVLVDQAGPKH